MTSDAEKNAGSAAGDKELINDTQEILASELIDELEAEIHRFWESERARSGEEISREDCANLWLETYYDAWLAQQTKNEIEGKAKRRYRRVPFTRNAAVKILWTPEGKLDGASESVQLRDLSEGGLYFFSLQDIPDTSLLEIELVLSDAEPHHLAMGVIVRKTPKSTGFGYGVSFSHVPDECRVDIQRVVEKTPESEI